MKEFIKKMLSNRDDISSKRITGILLILQYFTMVYLSTIITFSKMVADLSKTGLTAGLLLLGVAAVEKIWKQ